MLKSFKWFTSFTVMLITDAHTLGGDVLLVCTPKGIDLLKFDTQHT